MISRIDRNTLLGLGEAPSLYDPAGDGEQLIVRDEYVLFLGRSEAPSSNTVQRLRLVPDRVGAVVDEVRALARDAGRTALVWEVASTAEPADLADRLRMLGMEPYTPPSAVVMALRAEPPRPPDGIAVSRVETVEEFKTFVAITHEVFDMLDRLEAELERIDREGASDLEDRNFVRYVARLDGEPIAAATATFTKVGAIIHSGSTRAAARHRGAYRALVAARWEDSARRGTPALVTRAGPMSRPILLRAGFEELAEITFLVDRFDWTTREATDP